MAQAELQMIVDNPGTFRAFAAESPSEEDQIRLIHWLFAFLRSREFEWRLFKDGVMDKAHFESYAGAIPLVLGTPRTREFWTRYRQFYDSEFAGFVDSKIEEAPLLDEIHFRGVMTIWADSIES